MISIGAALSDPAIFGPWFPGSSWDGWRAVMRGAFAERMTKPEREFFRSVANREPPEHRVKEFWAICGRRAGKDSVASAIAAHTAASFEPAGRLRPGERAWLAVDRAQTQTVLGYTRSYFEKLPALAAMVERETNDGFALKNGVDIAIVTNDYRGIRGRTVLCCIMDEVAYWRSENSASPDKEVYRALRPSMLTLSESMLIGITTAYHRSGLRLRSMVQALRAQRQGSRCSCGIADAQSAFAASRDRRGDGGRPASGARGLFLGVAR